MKNTFLFIITILHSTLVLSQSMSGDIEDHLSSIIASLPGSSGNDYTPPTFSELATWENAVAAILNGAIPSAKNTADSLNYQVTEYTDTTINQLFYVLEEKAPQTNYWGTYVFNPGACRAGLVLQAPHSKYDSNTGYEAIYCYKRISAKVLFLSGTHRCNHSSTSVCSGTTGSCGGSSQPFRISDMAHNETSIFQKTTEVVDSHINNAVFIQLHGFSKQSTDPYVIMSNGTRNTPVPDYITQIQNELFATDNSLTFKIAHIDTVWSRLIGFTNTQGRLLNGSSSPCSTSATTTTGGFIHIEQEKSKLRQDSTGWNKMYVALSNVFACVATSQAENVFKEKEFSIFPNPVSTELSIETENIQHILLMDMKGKLLFSKSYEGVPAAFLGIGSYAKGPTLIKIQTDKTTINQLIIIE